MKHLRKRKYFFVLPAIVICLASCGNQAAEYLTSELEFADPNSETVVRARGLIELSSGPPQALLSNFGHPFIQLLSNDLDVEVSALSILTLDKSEFLTPTISNAVIDFGYLKLSTLLDTSLSVCGSNGKKKCNKAFIRTYTIGTPKAGIYNSKDDFGAPLTAGQTSLSSVGLNSTGSLTLQSITIPSNKSIITNADFPNSKYRYKADFTEAGAGTYSTTIVVEYVLTE
jgi:hypothetical protein